MSAERFQASGAATSSIAIAMAWAVVILPAAWGVYNTVLRAARLFH